jgi:hypothetical protein
MAIFQVDIRRTAARLLSISVVAHDRDAARHKAYNVAGNFDFTVEQEVDVGYKVENVAEYVPAAPTPFPPAGLYTLGFTAGQWDELEALGFGAFEIDRAAPGMPRAAWQAIAALCLGKAELIKEGRYGESDADCGMDEWAEELREIARVILAFFKPGDGKL